MSHRVVTLSIFALRSLVSRTAGQTESDVLAPGTRAAVDVAEGNSGAVSAVLPATATDAAGVAEIQIEAPLPNIPAHVINPEFVRELFPRRMCLTL